MFSVAPVTSTPTALTLPSSVATATASEQVSTRQTLAAIPAPLPDTRLADNTQRNAGTEPNTVQNKGSSSAFLAQLFSQQENAAEDRIGLSTTFAKFAPAPTYNTLIGYSVVKFRPSNAGLPSPYASVSKSKTETTSQSSQAYNATLSRNTSALSTAPEERFTIAG